MRLTTEPHLMTGLRMSGAIHPLPQDIYTASVEAT